MPDTSIPPQQHGNNGHRFWIGLTVVCTGFVLMYAARLDLVPGRTAYWAALASSGFILAAWPRRGERNASGLLTLAGLCACWFGDVLGPLDFATGAYAFLVAHLFFAAACWMKGIVRHRAAAMLVAILPIDILLLWRLLPAAPAQEITLILAYTTVISVMVVVAAGAGKHTPSLLAAAVLFFISDVFVAFWRFGDSAASGWLCYPLYYTACLLFAHSIHAGRR